MLGASSANVAFALQEVEGVLVVSPGALEFDDGETLDAAERELVIKALAEAKTPTVLLSSIGAHLTDGPALVAGARAWEQRLGTLVPLRIIRRAFLAESFAPFLAEARVTGRLRSLFTPTAPPIPVIGTQDVVALVTQWLEQPSMLAGEVVELEGPRRVTAPEMATMLSGMTSRPITVETVPPDDWPALWRSLGGSVELGQHLGELVQHFNAGRLDFEARARRAPTLIETLLPSLISS